MTKENVIPMQFLQPRCLGSCNFPKDKRSKWNLGQSLSLTPLHCPNQVSQGIWTPCPWGKNQVSFRHLHPLLGHLGWNFHIPLFLGVTWSNISISLVPWATKLWASILGELCLCQGKWVLSQGNWDFKVPFFPTRRLGWIFQISFFFSDQVLGPSSGGNMCFLGQMRGFMKCLGPKLDHLGATRDWKYSNKLP